MLTEDFAETFWRRHANPKSGWSRTLTLPVILYGVYRRDWRFLTAALAFTAFNPLLFSPPESEDAWMTRVVLAERWWTDELNRSVLGLSYPAVLNVANLATTAYAVLAAYRRRPRRTAVAGAATMALKLWFVAALVRRYDARAANS
jgi:hypothetical protein